MILNTDSGILDDVMMSTFQEDVLMVVNASNVEKLLDWFDSFDKKDVSIESFFDSHALLAIQGPDALRICDDILNTDTESKKSFDLWETSLFNQPSILMRTGYTGELGCELVVPKSIVNQVWDSLVDGGVTPCGLGARDTLRLEAGLPLYGQELSETISPLQTRYPWVVDFNKTFVGKDALLKQKEQGVEKKAVGIEMIDKGIARSQYEIKRVGLSLLEHSRHH